MEQYIPPRLPDYDVLVIGGSSGGLAVAKEAAGFQKRVLLLDWAAPSAKGTKWDMGEDMSSVRKLVHQAALLGKAIQDSQKYGWKLEGKVSHSWGEMVEGVQQSVRSRSLELRRELRACGVTVLHAHGEIVGPHTVQATDINGRRTSHTAETLVIATGDKPRYPDIPGDKEHCLISDDLFSLPHAPGQTLVVGGSAEGLECAGFLSGLGSEVTVLLQHGGLLPGFDKKMAQKIENHMLVHGVNFIYHCSLSKVEQAEACSSDMASSAVTPQPGSPGRLRVSIVSKDNQRTQEFDTVLLAVEREPCASGIGLEVVGVKCNQDTGRVLVNERDQTSADHVYAVGSVQHGHRPATAGLSMHAGTLLARRLCGGDTATCDFTNIPTVLFTPVEYAACGLSEERANIQFGEASVEVYHGYYWPLEWIVPARNKNSCYVKIICNIPDHERVVGLHVLGPNAGDIVQGFAVAMKCGFTKRQLDATVGVHPLAAQVLTTLTVTQRATEAMMIRGNC